MKILYVKDGEKVGRLIFYDDTLCEVKSVVAFVEEKLKETCSQDEVLMLSEKREREVITILVSISSLPKDQVKTKA